ncbi:hypothetical protein [Massilia sp. TWP1-3-3]|uniref:hypothetical protein n=1 Tax=Massilia sp. TWP1-3-3 TaxID=2804573 RepID=UPI003CE94F97
MQNPTKPSLPLNAPALHAIALAALLLAGSGAHAADDVYPALSFSGFGSLGVVHSDYDQADFTSNILKGDGAGGSHNWAANLDSRLGGQLGVKFDKQWSAVVQLGVEQRYDSSYRPQVEWANVKYQATPDLALRVGRIALPIFLAADYRKIGYAYPWARTPNEVYGGVPITNSDGADIAYRWQAGRVKHTTQAFFGRTDVYLTKTTNVKARHLAGITHTAEWGPATVRVSAFTTVLDLNIVRELFDGFRKFGPAGATIADKYDVVDKRTSGFAVGLNYDPGKWFLMAEAGRISTPAFLGDTLGMYASAGYRSGNFTPYLSYSQNRVLSQLSDPGLPLAGLPPPYAYAAAQLNGNLNVLLTSISSQTNLAAGVRWDFRPDMALKLQYEHLTPRDGTRGTLINTLPGFVSGRSVNVTSAVLDFVF